MKRLWQIFVLWILWVFILWLMAPCVDQKPELEPHEKLTYLVPRCCSCLWFKFRKCGCPSGTLNYSLCNHTVREQNWFDAYYEKTMGFLMGATESMPRNAELSWLDEPGPCSQLRDGGEPNHGTLHLPQGCWGLGFLETAAATSAEAFWSVMDFRHSEFWNMIQFPIGMEDSKDQDASFGFGSEKQGKLSHDWEDANQNNGSKEVLSMPSTEAEVECVGKLAIHT